MQVKSSNGKTMLNYTLYVPENPKGVIHLVHGLTEDISMYEDFSEYMQRRGYIVLCHDVLGHGNSLKENKTITMGKEEWINASSDIIYVKKSCLSEEQKKLPYYLIGFSFGSFLVRSLLSSLPVKATKIILVGTGLQSNLALKLAKVITTKEVRKVDWCGVSETVNNLALLSNNKMFEKEDKSPFAWLFVDRNYRDIYKTNLMRGENISPGYFLNMIDCMHFCCNNYVLDRNSNIPILLLSGSEDPVTKNIKKVVKFLKNKGMTSVDYQLMYGYRHCILNDNCRVYVWDRIHDFIEREEYFEN